MEGWLGACIAFRLDPGIISEHITGRNCCVEGGSTKQRSWHKQVKNQYYWPELCYDLAGWKSLTFLWACLTGMFAVDTQAATDLARKHKTNIFLCINCSWAFSPKHWNMLFINIGWHVFFFHLYGGRGQDGVHILISKNKHPSYTAKKLETFTQQ